MYDKHCTTCSYLQVYLAFVYVLVVSDECIYYRECGSSRYPVFSMGRLQRQAVPLYGVTPCEPGTEFPEQEGGVGYTHQTAVRLNHMPGN